MVAWARILVQIVGQSSSYGGFIVLYLFMIMSIITDSTKDSTHRLKIRRWSTWGAWPKVHGERWPGR